MRRAALLPAIVALTLGLAGCGGGGGGGPKGPVSAGAEFAPKSSAAFVQVDTNVTSRQWRAADALLKRFPGRQRLLQNLRRSAAGQHLTWDRDIRPALGDAVYVVWLDFRSSSDAVGFAKPHDRAKFDRLLESGNNPSVHRVVDGWTVFADKTALLDRFQSERSSGSLGDEDPYREATGALPGEPLAEAFVNGDDVQAAIDRGLARQGAAKAMGDRFGHLRWIGASAVARGGGALVHVAAKVEGGQKPSTYKAVLPGELPAGALAFLSLGPLEGALRSGLDAIRNANPNFSRQLAQIEQALGFSVKRDVFPLFGKEAGVAVYRGAPYPAVVLALAVDDEGRAQHVVDRVTALFQTAGGGTSREVTINGVRVTELSPSGAPISIYAAVSRHRLLLTSSERAIRAALGNGTNLADDARYKAALAGAGVPSETTGLTYVDLQSALPFVFGLAGRYGGQVPADVSANMRPLQSLVVDATQDGDVTKLTAFVRIR